MLARVPRAEALRWHPPLADLRTRGHPYTFPYFLFKQGLQSPFRLNEQPSMRRALPPVGTHSTALQLEQTTTVCEWLNTVVLQASHKEEKGVSTHWLSSSPHLHRASAQRSAERRAGCEANSHGEAALALDIHKVRVRRLYQPVKLVPGLLKLRRGMQQVDVTREHLRRGNATHMKYTTRASITVAYPLVVLPPHLAARPASNPKIGLHGKPQNRLPLVPAQARGPAG